MIPKSKEITDNYDYGVMAYFMSYYFPKRLLAKYSHRETKQNERFRSWLLAFKDLTKDGEIKKDFMTTSEFKLFKIVLSLFVKNKILKNTFNQIYKIGLIHIPSHKKYSECKHNAISLLITELCKEQKFIDMTKTIFRSETIPKGTRDINIKKGSMSWNKKELEKIKQIKLDNIIIIDDVYTSGATTMSMFEKIQESDIDIIGSNICELCINNDVKFFAFGKTLSEEQIEDNTFSNPNDEIFLPEVSSNERYSKNDNNKFRASLKSIK